jgi:hypothetical protein
MIYDIQYRDGANYKKWLRAEINTFPLNEGKEEIEMEESGLTMHEFFDHMGWEFCAELDHNKLEILGLSNDQISEPEIRFIN